MATDKVKIELSMSSLYFTAGYHVKLEKIILRLSFIWKNIKNIETYFIYKRFTAELRFYIILISIMKVQIAV